MIIIITESTSILRLAHKILQPTPTTIVEILCTINFSAQVLSTERNSPTSIFPRQNQRAQSAEKSWQDKMETYQPVARVAKSGETQVWVWWNHTHWYLIKGPADQLGWICKHNAEHRKYHLTKFKRRDMEKMRSSPPRQRPKGGGMTTICDGLAMETLQNPSPYKSWYNFERRLGLSDWRVLNTEFWPRRSNPRVERHNLNSVIQLPHTNSPATFQCKKFQHLCGRNQQCAPNHCEKNRTKGVMWDSKALQQQQKRRVKEILQTILSQKRRKKKTTVSSQMLEQKTLNKQGGKKNLRDGFAVTKPHSKWSAYQTAVCCYWWWWTHCQKTPANPVWTCMMMMMMMHWHHQIHTPSSSFPPAAAAAAPSPPHPHHPRDHQLLLLLHNLPTKASTHSHVYWTSFLIT